MPSHVRIFWWLSVAIVTCWILVAAWFLVFPLVPSAHEVAVLAKFPSEIRDLIHRADRQYEIMRIVSTVVWSAVTLGLAWFATFRHANWARWAYVALSALREVGPYVMVFMTYYQAHRLDLFEAELAHWNWTDPRIYLVPALTIAAIAFVFSGNARDWFRAPRSSA